MDESRRMKNSKNGAEQFSPVFYYQYLLKVLFIEIEGRDPVDHLIYHLRIILEMVAAKPTVAAGGINMDIDGYFISLQSLEII